MTGRLLGLDPGERRVGVALSDPLGIIAQPHCVIDRRKSDVATEVRRLVKDEDIKKIVVGLPVSLDGREARAAVAARRFGKLIADATGLEVTYFDERFTTSVAESTLLEGRVRRVERRALRDKVAAAVMLQGYLDSQARIDEQGRKGDAS